MSTKKPPQLDWREGRRRRAWELKQQGWKQQDKVDPNVKTVNEPAIRELLSFLACWPADTAGCWSSSPGGSLECALHLLQPAEELLVAQPLQHGTGALELSVVARALG